MADNVSKERRSKMMAAIKGKNTKPEMLVRQFLFANGLRFRLHDKKLPGTPDIKLTKYKTLVFVHGCFWHGHSNCRLYTTPKSNIPFWTSKIERNIARHQQQLQALSALGWRVVVVWECNLKPAQRATTLASLLQTILAT